MNSKFAGDVTGSATISGVVKGIESSLADHIKRTLSPEEANHVQHMREIGFGSINVVVKNGNPVMGHEAVKDVKYTK